MEPLVTFVIGTFNRPLQLRGLLAALQAQTHENWTALVMDEGADPGFSLGAYRLCRDMMDPRIRHHSCGPRRGDWHQTVKNEGAAQTEAEWLVFPADDAYYAPSFIERMLETASFHAAELVYCNWIYDLQGYMPWIANPRVGHIDVGGFMVTKAAWQRVPWTSRAQTGDGKWVEEMVSSGIRHARCESYLYVKN